MMQQWHRCKAKARDALVLFRLGDFYEAFYEDAHVLSKSLELTLTQRQGIPMSGIPSQTLDSYIEKLLLKGFLVAVAEQVEEAKEAKGIVKREITRIVSPATHTESRILPEKANNFFASCCQINQRMGLAFIDISTSEMIVSEMETIDGLLDELHRKSPLELLVSEKFSKTYDKELDELKSSLKLRITSKPDWCYDHQTANNFLTGHFNVQSLEGFGLKGMVGAVNAAGVLLSHLQDDLSQNINHIESIRTDHLSDFLLIDHTTKAHLNISKSSSNIDEETLIHLVDQTSTPMGGRKMRQWIHYPLICPTKISTRLNTVEALIPTAYQAEKLLSPIRDTERLANRIKTGAASPRDLFALGLSLKQIPKIKEYLESVSGELCQSLLSGFVDLDEPTRLILSSLQESPPMRATEGAIFRDGYHQELDEYRKIKSSGKEWISNYQACLREELNIKSLKVGFNRAFGYYIEVSRLQSSKVPEQFVKRQTLVNTERFISPSLKEYETKVLEADEKILTLEYELFVELRAKLLPFADSIITVSKAIATLDCLLSLARVAKEQNYTKPVVDGGQSIEIIEGRHPIVEKFLPDRSFIPNNTLLSTDDQQLILLTGPNMAGKSTYMRQVALICILAQMGSFVPAKQAHIGVVDKLFSRIGASDYLSRGQSTFMVEMLEAANILRNATPRSLVILDEIGRGTSTYDGISIAWAVAKHLVQEIGCRSLFATHYWELTRLEKEFPKVKNYQVAVQENEDGIIFLHKILKGHADKSYGIHVAKLAGVPLEVIKCARGMLKELETTKPSAKKPPPRKNDQFLLFSQEPADSEIVKELQSIDINTTTPLKALELLSQWKKLVS